MTEKNATTERFGDVVYRYTRAQAIEEGALVDVSKTANEVGFKYPVAITQAAWQDCVAWSDTDDQRQVPNLIFAQDEDGRLWDVLWMAIDAIHNTPTCPQIEYSLYRVPRSGRGAKARKTRLKMVCGPGDDEEPVITIMVPEED